MMLRPIVFPYSYSWLKSTRKAKAAADSRHAPFGSMERILNGNDGSKTWNGPAGKNESIK